MIAQIYVDDIVVGELTHFLGFQIKQMKEGIFVSQSKYSKNM